MNAIDIEVEVTSKATHDLVRFEIENSRTSAVVVEITQPLPGDVSPSQVATLAKHEGDSWSVTADALAFEHEIDWGMTMETTYAIKDVAMETLERTIAKATVEVRDRHGDTVERRTGLELQFENGPNRVAEDGRGSRGSPRIERDDETAPEVARTTPEASGGEPGGRGPRPAAARSRDAGDDDGAAGETPRPEEASPDGSDGRGETADPERSGIDDRTGHDRADDDQTGDGGRVDDDGRARLPNRPASFVLEDIPEDVRPEEFLWTSVDRDEDRATGRAGESQRSPDRESGDRPDRTGHETPGDSRGLLARIRSWLR